MTAIYDKDIAEALKTHPLYGNGNGNGNTSKQILEQPKPENSPAVIVYKEGSPKKRQPAPWKEPRKKCVECGSTNSPQWRKRRKGKGDVCNKCYSKQRREAISEARRQETAPLTKIFDQQAGLLRQYQKQLLREYKAIERQRQAIFDRLEAITESLQQC
jgi:hypothetical protein